MEKTKVIEFMLNIGDGGAETLVKDYALCMDKNQFEVTVVVLHEIEDSANMRVLQSHGIPVLALSSKEDLLKKVWRFFFRPSNKELTLEDTKEEMSQIDKISTAKKIVDYFRNKFLGWKLLKIIDSTGAQVIHGHLEVLAIMSAISAQLKGMRILHTCHNLPKLVYFAQEYVAAEKLIKNNAMQIIALHENMSQELNSMFGINNTVVIRNGIDMHKFLNPGITKEDKRLELGIPQSAFLVGHVGRFAVQKNHPFLVEVFREIAKRNENAYLLMVGAGDHSHIEEMLCRYGLDGRYQILSGRKDINEILTAMDVFVFPSVFEGFGNALLEAQAAGLRCIASDCCPREVVRTKDCIAMPLEAPEKWAQAAMDPNLQQSEDRPLKDYDMKEEIHRLERLYLGQSI